MPKGLTSIPARTDKIVELLEASAEPLTTEQILARFDVCRSAFDKSLILGRNQHRIYIACYDPPRGEHGGGTPIARFAAGNQPDTPKPKQTAEQAAARRKAATAAYRERAKAGIPDAPKPRRNAIDRPQITPQLDPISAALFGRAA